MGRCWIIAVASSWSFGQQPPTFHRDVAPILQQHCQECHRPGQSAPMALVTYREVRPWANAIRDVVLSRKMPPWFADPCCGHFTNDRSLSTAEISTLTKWVETKAPEGNPAEEPAPRKWPDGGNLASPDAIFSIPPFHVPAK